MFQSVMDGIVANRTVEEVDATNNISFNASRQQDIGGEKDEIEADDFETGDRNEKISKNYRITSEDNIGSSGAKTKVRANIAAIRTLKDLELDNQEPAEAEKKTLVKYVGWGAFAQELFSNLPAHQKNWARERVQLNDLLSIEEIDSTRATVNNAHYTFADVINGVWSAMEYLGFKGVGAGGAVTGFGKADNVSLSTLANPDAERSHNTYCCLFMVELQREMMIAGIVTW